jgi:GDP-4-dehydro-6-deoxy-D-mannose reductase
VRVLLTGATGFLGRRVAARLVADGCAVTGAALDPGGLPTTIPFRDLDVRDAAAVERTVAAVDPELVVHLAALSHVGESWRRIPDYWEVNVLGTEHVARAARGRRLLFVSSAEVYGAVPEEEQPIRETRPPAPRSPYALTKAAGERLAAAQGAILVRCFNLVGSGQAAAFALPSFAAQLATIAAGAAPPVLKVGNLSPRRDFVHVEDGADAIATLAARGAAGEIFNLASGEARSIGEALARLVEISGVAVTTVEDPARVRPVDVPCLCGDATRLAALGWRATRGFDRALEDLWHEAVARQGSGARALA